MVGDIDDDIRAAIGLSKDDAQKLALLTDVCRRIISELFMRATKDGSIFDSNTKDKIDSFGSILDFVLRYGVDVATGDLVSECDNLFVACKLFANDVHNAGNESNVIKSHRKLSSLLDVIFTSKIMLENESFALVDEGELISDLRIISESVRQKALNGKGYDCIRFRKRGSYRDIDVLRQRIQEEINSISADIAHFSVEGSDGFVIFTLYFDADNIISSVRVRRVVSMIINLGVSMTETNKNGEVVRAVGPRSAIRLVVDNECTDELDK